MMRNIGLEEALHREFSLAEDVPVSFDSVMRQLEGSGLSASVDRQPQDIGGRWIARITNGPEVKRLRCEKYGAMAVADDKDEALYLAAFEILKFKRRQRVKA